MSWLGDKIRKRRRVGLSLSGGGLRGIGHIGAIQALEENGYKPVAIAGCSAGAIVGALYAAGHSPQSMLEIAKTHNLFPATSFRLRTTGLIDTRFLTEILRKYIPEDSFESLTIPLYIAATNLLTGKAEYFHQGRLGDAILASSSVPFIFPSVQRENVPYYDGGLLDNLPIKPLKNHCNFLVGVHVNTLDDINPAELTPIKTLDRIIHIAISRSAEVHAKRCDLYIEPPNMLRFGMFDKKKQLDIYRYVYDYTSEYLTKRR